MSKASSRKKLVIENQTACIAQVHDAVLDEVQRHGYSEQDIFGIRLALDEALANAIRHGNCGDPSKTVTVEYQVTDQSLEISITDEGCGFAPANVPDPTLDENLNKPCGRGVMLMKAYMDEVSFSEAGNQVTMKKKRG